MHALGMNVVLIPFFLAARVSIDSPWPHGPEYVFQVLVNSTAVPEEEGYGSVRLNLAAKLICQPRGSRSLSCHFEDSQATSFVSDSHDPDLVDAAPMSETSRQRAYEISQDQFELHFGERGLDSLLVNEDVQPRELDMIRIIVGQLHVGAIVANRTDRNYELLENFTQGECATTFTLGRKSGWRAPFVKRPYVLETAFWLRSDQILQIRRVRNLYMCTHKVPYFFGSADSLREDSEILSTLSSSESHITITPTEFVSGTTNVVTTSRIDEPLLTTLYENIGVRLESIQPAEDEPEEVRSPEFASIFIGSWHMDSSFDDES